MPFEQSTQFVSNSKNLKETKTGVLIAIYETYWYITRKECFKV